MIDDAVACEEVGVGGAEDAARIFARYGLGAPGVGAGRAYQLVDPASSHSPHKGCGHQRSPTGVSAVPITQGLPSQSCQVSGLHSA